MNLAMSQPILMNIVGLIDLYVSGSKKHDWAKSIWALFTLIKLITCEILGVYNNLIM